MPKRDVIVVAASAGGIEALRELLDGVPETLEAAMLVVVHMPDSGGDALRRILDRCTRLRVVGAEDDLPLEPGVVYVCVGGRHLLLGAGGRVELRQGPREHGHRPAADPLFRSAAAYYGPRVIGVVLSGGLSDGTAGLQAIRRQGGAAVVQDPDDALYDGMPSSAIEYVGADHVVAARDIGPLLGRIAAEDVDDRVRSDPLLSREVALMELGEQVLAYGHPGIPSPWPCPDCHGVLWEIDDGPVVRFRCRVGHAWSAESLLTRQGKSVEGALWMALRALEDRAALSHMLAERAELSGRPLSARRFRAHLEGVATSVGILRRVLATPPDATEDRT